MSSSEALVLQQAEIEKREEEIIQESPEVQIAEINNEQLQEYANVAEQQVERQSAEIISAGEQKIEVSTKSMAISPEMEQSVREEQGLGAKLGGIKAEADQFASEARGEIEVIVKEAQPGKTLGEEQLPEELKEEKQEQEKKFLNPEDDPLIAGMDKEITQRVVTHHGSFEPTPKEVEVYRAHAKMDAWQDFATEHPEKTRAYLEQGDVQYKDKENTPNWYHNLKRGEEHKNIYANYKKLNELRVNVGSDVSIDGDDWKVKDSTMFGLELSRKDSKGNTYFRSIRPDEYADLISQKQKESALIDTPAYTPKQIASMEKERPKNEKEKRFVLSGEKFSKERLTALKEEVDSIKGKYPEVLSFSMYGSMVKGTAHEGSDFDGYLFVDAEKVAEQQHVPLEQILDVSYENDSLFTEDIENRYRIELQSKLKERLQLGHDFVEDIKVRPISEKIIDKEIEKMLGYYSAEEKYQQDSIKWYQEQPGMNADDDELRTYEKRRPQQPKYVGASFGNMFNLDVGGGIRKYRKLFIEKLLKLGEKGEKIWADTIIGTEMMENNFSTDKTKRYPRTLEEAVKVYG